MIKIKITIRETYVGIFYLFREKLDFVDTNHGKIRLQKTKVFEFQLFHFLPFVLQPAPTNFVCHHFT